MRILHLRKSKNIENIHFDFYVKIFILFSNSYFSYFSVYKYNTKLSSFFIMNSFFSNPLSAILNKEYLYAG